MRINSIEILKSDKISPRKILFYEDEGETKKYFDEIYFVGENGTGKTTILTLINQAFRWDNSLSQKREVLRSLEKGHYKLNISFSKSDISKIKEKSRIAKTVLIPGTNEEHEFIIEINNIDDVNQNGSQTIFYRVDRDGNKIANQAHAISNDQEWLAVVQPIYLTPEIQFSSDPIREVGSMRIDNPGISEKKFSASDSRQIKHLLIDVCTESLLENAELIFNGDTTGTEISKLKSSLNNSGFKRFQNAFNSFFNNKIQLSAVKKGFGDFPNEFSVIFKKNNNQFDIQDLSTGEKQIVYRGSFILKDSGSDRVTFLLIDEPEISLHPTWQRKIVKYYRDILVKVDDLSSTTQTFIATHSPFVIQGASNACFLIFQRDENGLLKIEPKTTIENMNPNEISYEAFGLESLYNEKMSEEIIVLKKQISELASAKRPLTEGAIRTVEAKLEKQIHAESALALSADLLKLQYEIENLKKMYDSRTQK